MTFEQWIKAVDKLLERKCGLHHDDLPDWGYWDAWNDGVRPESAAARALKAAKE